MPSWNTDDEKMEIVKNAISSFREATPEAELVIVDNGSTVGGGYRRSEADVYIRLPKTIGYTPAIRYGMLVANGEYLALVNDDIRMSKNWADIVLPIFEDEDVATVHPRMIGYDEPMTFGTNTVKTGKERWCHNSCVVTTRKFLKEFERIEENQEPYPGMFDLNYGIGGGADDWDLYYRIRKQGYKTVYTDKCCFQHKMSFTYNKISEQREQVVKQNNEYFEKKHGGTKEELFTKEFPDQMNQDYRKGWEL